MEDGHLSRSPLIGEDVTSLVAQSENHITNLGKRGNACDLPNDFYFKKKGDAQRSKLLGESGKVSISLICALVY